MSGVSLDAFTRRAAEMLSRRSLLALGAATVGAAALPGSAWAGECSQTCRRRVKNRCERQAGQCAEAVKAVCGQVSNPTTRQQCLDSCLPCCEPEGDCLNGEKFECLVTCAIFL